MQVDVVILGAGAAGLFAGIEAGRRGRSVLVVEGAARPGEKIRISGGGRCNFTNTGIEPDRFLSRNPRFVISALKRYTWRDFLARVEGRGIAWHEKTLGQLFCDGRSTQIVDMLRAELEDTGATLWLGTQIIGVTREVSGFAVTTSRGMVTASACIVATGGKSIPKMGASSIGYRIAETFGVPLTETRPALVPLTLAEQDLAGLSPLAGISVTGAVACDRTRFREAVLFTHRGLSGPAVLQTSSYWREGRTVSIDLAEGRDVEGTLRLARTATGRSAVRTALATMLPDRLARHIEAMAGVSGTLGDQSNVALARIARQVQDWQMRPVGSEGYRTAEVTLGGVETDALDARTMEAKAVPGLYFIGEVVDVTGWLGGYNFQWAWSSAWAAGQVA